MLWLWLLLWLLLLLLVLIVRKVVLHVQKLLECISIIVYVQQLLHMLVRIHDLLAFDLITKEEGRSSASQYQ